jgi:hypothetical protein
MEKTLAQFKSHPLYSYNSAASDESRCVAFVAVLSKVCIVGGGSGCAKR